MVAAGMSNTLYHPRWQEEHGLVARSRTLDFIKE